MTEWNSSKRHCGRSRPHGQRGRRNVHADDSVYAVESFQGATDDELLAFAFSEGRTLLTEDKDFGELIYRLRRPARGIVLLRFDVADRSLKIPRLRDLLAREVERLPGAFVVLEADKVRIRPL